MSTIKFKRTTKDRWEELNLILDSGEPGYEKDTGKWKIGNGVTHWNDLDYQGEDPTAPVTFQDLEDHINSPTPHPVYDDGPSLALLYENAKV